MHSCVSVIVSDYLPPRDRAHVCRTWSVCRAEGSRWSVCSGREAPSTAETFFQMHGCRSYTRTKKKKRNKKRFQIVSEDFSSLFILHYEPHMCISPENRQVWRLHQHLHQRVHHFCVEDDGVHHFSKLLVIGYTETGFGNTGVGLQGGKHVSTNVYSLYCVRQI